MTDVVTWPSKTHLSGDDTLSTLSSFGRQWRRSKWDPYYSISHSPEPSQLSKLTKLSKLLKQLIIEVIDVFSWYPLTRNTLQVKEHRICVILTFRCYSRTHSSFQYLSIDSPASLFFQWFSNDFLCRLLCFKNLWLEISRIGFNSRFITHNWNTLPLISGFQTEDDDRI